MANTYVLIASNTLSSAAASVTFSSIPGTYTDLVLRWSSRSDRTGNILDVTQIRFNGDSNANYSRRTVYGDGASALSANASGDDSISNVWTNAGNSTSSTFSSNELYIPNYTSTAKKTSSLFNVLENNATTAYVQAQAGLYNTSIAITSIVLTNVVSTFVSGSSFWLYGIKAN